MFEVKDNLKKIITAVILVVLILAAFSMLLSPSVRADTSEAKILSYSWYVAPANAILPGDLIAVGEVQNVGSNVIGSVSVVGLAYNSTGGLLDSSKANIYIYDMLPGQKAPFYMYFIPEYSITQDLRWVPSVSNVTVLVNYVSDTNATPYSGLTIPTGGSASNSSGTYTVTGTVQNTGNEIAGNVLVDTTFYNASGSVVAMNVTNYLSSSLAPGGSVPFTATPMDNTAQLSNEIASYALLIQSVPVTTTSTTPSPTPLATSTPSPTSSSNASTQPTQSPAPLSSGLIYAIVVVVVVVAAVLAALLLLRKRHKNTQFEPPPPPPPP